MSYREVIVGGAIVGFFVVLSMAAEPWLGSDQSSVTDVIQLALTPAFLLTAVAALLNVFSTRLGRVADRVDLLSADLQRGAADTEFLSGFSAETIAHPGRGRRVGNGRRRGNLRRCACFVFRHVERCGIQDSGIRSFWRCDYLHDYSIGYICNRNDNGWTWAKGRRPPHENGRSKQVRSENLLSRSVLVSFAYRLRNSQRSAQADSIRGVPNPAFPSPLATDRAMET